MPGDVMQDDEFEDIARHIAFANSASVDLEKYGYVFRKGKTYKDLDAAKSKAFKTPPFKTECHLSLLSVYIKAILKKVRRK